MRIGRPRILILVLAALVGFAGLVWPTMWVYGTEHQQSKGGSDVAIPIRVHRISGQKQHRDDEGWHDGSVQID